MGHITRTPTIQSLDAARENETKKMNDRFKTLLRNGTEYVAIDQFTVMCRGKKHNIFFKCYGYGLKSNKGKPDSRTMVIHDRVIYPRAYRHVIIGGYCDWETWDDFLDDIMPGYELWDWFDWKDKKCKKT